MHRMCQKGPRPGTKPHHPLQQVIETGVMLRITRAIGALGETTEPLCELRALSLDDTLSTIQDKHTSTGKRKDQTKPAPLEGAGLPWRASLEKQFS